MKKSVKKPKANKEAQGRELGAKSASKQKGSKKQANSKVISFAKSPIPLNPKETGGKRILVIDIGGSNVKLMMADQPRRKIPSRSVPTPAKLVAAVQAHTKDWEFDAVSIGFPAPVEDGKILQEPNNLAPGWVKFDWEKALKKPVRVINDAAMQALGSYAGGRMLFLGLGTGLGSALVHHGTLIPLELCGARYNQLLSFEDVLGKRGYKQVGLGKWEKYLHEIVALVRGWFLVDYVVLGGGNVKKLDKLPQGTRLGDNRNAFLGGLRMWSEKIEAANRRSAALE